jgi:release factor glutamine methyltransferase
MASVYETTVARLAAAHIDSPRLEARLLIGFAIGQDADEIHEQTKLTDAQGERLEKALAQRLNRCPIDKILGRKEFYKYTFEVNTHVLSPRPDTEILVEEAIDLVRRLNLNKIADLGTGSGCILCSILADCPKAQGIGVDLSEQALAVAEKNAQNLGLSSRCALKCADWFEDDFEGKVGTSYDLLVSNPPYIAHEQIETLDDDVKNYDPLTALDGGADGYESYRKIAKVSQTLVRHGGYVLIEAGYGQAENIGRIFCAGGHRLLRVLKDLSGIDRCLVFVRV